MPFPTSPGDLAMAGLTLYHIPVCPFSQRLEILLALKDRRDAVDFHAIDITQPRPDWLLARTRGTTALPVLETPEGHIIKESLVILRYLESIFPDPPVARRDPYRHAVENMLVALADGFITQGYLHLMNQDPARRDALRLASLEHYTRLDDFLVQHAPHGPFLFEEFGWAEAVYTPFFMRFWCLEYYEDFHLPDTQGYARVRAWRDACVAHPAARQVTREQVVKLYYDYALGVGNGALPPGRARSSFVFQPDWSTRPWPPRDKYGHRATDGELGLI